MENQAIFELKDDQNKGSDLNGKLPIQALSNQITTQDGATIEFDKVLTKEQYIAILDKINNDINILLKDENFLAKLTNENLKITSISNYTFKNATIISKELNGVTFENCIIEENASIHLDNEKIIFNNCKFCNQTSIHSSNAEAEIIISNSTLPEKISANTKGDERIKSRQNALKFVGKFKNLTLDSNQDGGLINTSLAEIKKDNMNNPIIFIQNGSPLDSTQVLKLYGGSLIKKGNLRKEIITAQIQAKINDAKNNNEDIDDEEALSRCIISENERKINIVGGINFLTKCQTNLGKETNNSKKALEEINEAIISIVKLASNNNYYVTSLDPNSLGLIDTYTRIFSLSDDEKIAIEKFLNEKLNELLNAPQEHKKNETDNPPRDNNDSQPVQASTTQTILKEFIKEKKIKVKTIKNIQDNISQQTKESKTTEENELYERQGEQSQVIIANTQLLTIDVLFKDAAVRFTIDDPNCYNKFVSQITDSIFQTQTLGDSLGDSPENSITDNKLYEDYGITEMLIVIPLKFKDGVLAFLTTTFEGYSGIISQYKCVNGDSMTCENFLKTEELSEFMEELGIKVSKIQDLSATIQIAAEKKQKQDESESNDMVDKSFTIICKDATATVKVKTTRERDKRFGNVYEVESKTFIEIFDELNENNTIESMQILIPLMFSDSRIDEDVDSIEVYKKVKELYKTFSKDDNGKLITGNEFLKLPEVKQFHDEFNFTTVNEEKIEANNNYNNKTNNTSRKKKKLRRKRMKIQE